MSPSVSDILGRRGSWSPIGVDFGQRTVKAAQCHRVRGGWRLARAITIPRADPTALPTLKECERLAGVLSRQAFRGDDVVVAGPAGMIMTLILDLPPRASGAPLATIVRMELARAHKVDAASIESAWWDLPETTRPGGGRVGDGVAALAVGMTHEHAATIMDNMSGAGLRVRAIEPLPCALARGLVPLCTASGNGLNAVVDIGWSSATVSLLRGSTLVYTRVIADAGVKCVYGKALSRSGMEDSPLEDVLAAPGHNGASGRRAADREVLSQVEAHAALLSRELKTSLAYASHRFPGTGRSTVLLVGGGAELPGLAQQIEAALDASASPVVPAMLTLDCTPSLVPRGASGLCGAISLTTHPCCSRRALRRAA